MANETIHILGRREDRAYGTDHLDILTCCVLVPGEEHPTYLNGALQLAKKVPTIKGSKARKVFEEIQKESLEYNSTREKQLEAKH